MEIWGFVFTGFVAVAVGFRLLEIERRLKNLEEQLPVKGKVKT